MRRRVAAAKKSARVTLPSRQPAEEVTGRRIDPSRSAASQVSATVNRPTRMQRRRHWWRRLARWWREALAGLVVLVVTLTALLVINQRDLQPQPVEQTWAERVEVSGRVGATPALVVLKPVSVLSPKFHQLIVGPGREITEGSPLILSITSFDGQRGQVISSAGRSSLSVGTASKEDFDPVLVDAVTGLTEGSRLLFARPVMRDGERVTELNVVDILFSAANGEVVADPGGPLQVSMNEAGPRITHDVKEKPTELTVQTLIAGQGPQVRMGDAVLAQYLSADWDTSVVLSSTWSTGTPQMIRLDSTMPGLRNALLDQRVGSRLAVSIPAEQAQGEATLMLVVDILGTESDTVGAPTPVASPDSSGSATPSSGGASPSPSSP